MGCTKGLPHALHVSTANMTDRTVALAMFARYRQALPAVLNLLAGAGYAGKPFADTVQELLGDWWA